MAIYDNNGSTNAEIGKLYDNNGTTSNQIGKVYDNNGTTNSLIYSANLSLVPNTDNALYADTSSTYWYSSHTVSWQADGSLYIWITSSTTSYACYKPFNVTNFTKATFVITTFQNSGNSLWLMIGPSSTYDSSYPRIESKGTGTFSLDISSLSGDAYLIFRGKHAGNVVFSQIYLE